MTKWKLVPVEPTDEMLDRGSQFCGQVVGARDDASAVYRAMLAAATEPPEEVIERMAREIWPLIPINGTGGENWWPRMPQHQSDWEGSGTAANEREQELCRMIARAALRAAMEG